MSTDFRMNRRQFLGTGAAALTAAGWSKPARAVERSDLKFVFVLVSGGWDATRVFASEFENPEVDMESDAEARTEGELTWVDKKTRPSVTALMETWGDRICIVNGMDVPSVSHPVCMRLSMTGMSGGSTPDWPTLIAVDQADRYSLPHVVINGPLYAGSHGPLVSRIGTTGSIEALLNGELLEWSDTPLRLPGEDLLQLMDELALAQADERVAQAYFEREAAMMAAHQSSLQRGSVLEGVVDQVTWASDSGLSSQADLAVDMLALGVSRCCLMTTDDLSWDSHAENDKKQDANFEALFSGVVHLMEKLAETPGSTGGMLSEETCVVLMSEMGRTPKLNDGEGKDHWSANSAMVINPFLQGGRTIGGYNDLFYGAYVDPESGLMDESGIKITTPVFGASLLAIADIDASMLGTDIDILEAMVV